LRTHLTSYVSSISPSTPASTSNSSSPSTDTQAHTIPNPNINIFLFSIHHALNQILDLDDPTGFRQGFTPEEVTDIGRIWTDDLHLTADVHEIIADHIVEALFGESPSPDPSPSPKSSPLGDSKVSGGK
jgi:hypothetical protein